MHLSAEHSCNGSSPLADARKISVAREFSETPFGRYRSDGPESGQVFREKILKPALKKGKVILDIDGVDGLPSSFWEEVMGGLIRDSFTVTELKGKLEVVTSNRELEVYIRNGWRYAKDAEDRIKSN